MHTTQPTTQQPTARFSERLDNFSCTVERYQSLVWAIAYASTGDRSQSDDITQETFLAAWKQQADIRDVTKMRSYFAGIARNLAFRSHRQRHRHASRIAPESELGASADSNAPSPLELMLERERSTIVAEALRSIPSASREPFVLFYAKGKSIASVASELELTEAVVKQRLYRARKSLKAAVASQLVDAIVEGRPGKALVAATVGLIVGQSSSVLAAEAGGSMAAPLAARIHEVGASADGATRAAASMVVVSKALLVAAALTVLLFAGALFYRLAPASPAVPAEQRSAVASISPAPVAPSQEQTERPMRDPSSKLALALPTDWRDKASDQPLVVGRILQNIEGADANQDGALSVQELEQVATDQEELVVQLVGENWNDPLMAVQCSAVGFDGHETSESSHLYRLAELQADYLQDKEAGADLSPKEWFAKRIVPLSQQGQICYQVRSRYADPVQQLRASAADGEIKWTARMAVEDGTIVHFEPPKGLAKDLQRAASEDELAKVAEN